MIKTKFLLFALRNNPATAVYNPDGSFAGPVTPNEIALQVPNPMAQVLSVFNKLTRESFRKFICRIQIV